MYRVGLTGGIASGKSTVSQFFREKGVPILDADKAARLVVEKGSEGLNAIREYFGEGVLTEEGTLNREALAKIVFSDEKKRLALNEIMHKRIRAQLFKEEEQYASEGYQAVIFDVPLLIETKWYENMDEVWLVYTEDDVRIERLMERDTLTKEQCEARLLSQMSQDEKIQFAQSIIDNSGTEEELRARLEALWSEKGNLFRKEKP